MKDASEYKALQEKCFNIWHKYKSFDFKKEILNTNYSYSLYSKKNYKKNFPLLGFFNYFRERASNVYPLKHISFSIPNTKHYLEYLFVNNSLKLVKHITKGLDNTMYMFIHDDYVFELSSHFELFLIKYKTHNYQFDIAQGGINVEYMEKLKNNRFKLIHINLLSFVEETLELKGNIFYTIETNRRILRKREDIEFLNNNRNPYPLPNADKFITFYTKMLKDAGFEEEE